MLFLFDRLRCKISIVEKSQHVLTKGGKVMKKGVSKIIGGIACFLAVMFVAVSAQKVSAETEVDNEPDTKEAAKAINDCVDYQGSSEFNGDTDWFTFTTRYSGDYRVNVKNNSVASDIKFSLYSVSGDKILENYKISVDKELTKTFAFDANSTYFAKVEGLSIGNYTLSIKDPESLKLSYAGHNYAVYTVKNTSIKSWDDAVRFCQNMGGHMATITSSKENAAVFNYMTSLGYKNAFFGLCRTDKNVDWKWVNDQKVFYTNWGYGEPNCENGVEFYAMFYYKYPNGTWNDGDFLKDLTREGSVQIICEWDNGIDEEIEYPNIKTFSVDDFKYSVTDIRKATVKVVGYTGSSTKVELPSYVKYNHITFKVVTIGKNAFKDNRYMQEFKSPKTVETVEENAFKNCSALKKVTFNQVKTLNKNMFKGDKALKNITIKTDKKLSVKKKAFDGINSKAVITVKGANKKANKKAIKKVVPKKLKVK